MTKKIIIMLIVLAAVCVEANAQAVENALHISQPNVSISPRTGALGHAYMGISDDGAAMLYNPAGLTLGGYYEMGVGFNFANMSVKTDFLGNTKTQSSNNAYFSNVQFVFPYQSERYNYTFALGYFLGNDYDASTKYSGFNTRNTYTAQQASIKAPWTYETYIADENYNTNLKNNIQQNASIMESGGLHNIALAFAIDLSPNVALGGSLITKVGSYDYRRNYTESDPDNLHNETNVDDVDYVNAKEAMSQDIYGVTGIFGVQARMDDIFRFGMTVEFPTYLYIEEYSSIYHTVQYDANPNTGIADKYTYPSSGYGCYDPDYCAVGAEYALYTPFVFSFAASGNIYGATISAAVSYRSMTDFTYGYDDWEYDDPYGWNEYDDINEEIQEKLTGQFILGACIEYKLPEMPLYLRGSYTYATSPYIESSKASGCYTLGGGLGWVLFDRFIIDAAVVYSSFERQNTNYGTEDNPSLYSYYSAQYTPVNYSFGFRYRF